MTRRRLGRLGAVREPLIALDWKHRAMRGLTSASMLAISLTILTQRGYL